MPTQPPDFGMGKVMAIAGSLLMLWRMYTGIRAWRARKLRERQRQAMQADKRAAK